MTAVGEPRLGIRANAAQFTLLVAVNALVGGLLGQERTVLPLLAEHTFHLAAYTAALTYILAFGATKTVTNFFAGTLSDRYGRKPVLIAGWLAGLPVPLLLIWAPSWGWIVAANILLGVNQGLAWSTTVIMKVDLAWGLFPLLFATAGLSLGQIGALAALYPAVWGIGQLATGPLSDRYGRKPFIVTGMLLQAPALAWIAAATTFAPGAVAAVLLGAGTAMVYPTLLAAIGDVAHPTWRARAVGVYRLWRDGGFAAGALLAGILADAYGIRTATVVVAALTAASGILAAIRMYETHHRRTGHGRNPCETGVRPRTGR